MPYTHSARTSVPLVLLLAAAAVFTYSAAILFGWWDWTGNWQAWRSVGFVMIVLALLPVWTRDW